MDTRRTMLKRNIHVIIRNQASYSRHARLPVMAQEGGMFEFDETQAHKINMSLSWEPARNRKCFACPLTNNK